MADNLIKRTGEVVQVEVRKVVPAWACSFVVSVYNSHIKANKIEEKSVVNYWA